MEFKSKNTQLCGVNEYYSENKKTSLTAIAGTIVPPLMKKLGWNVNDIDILFVVTQTPDILLPSTAFCIQKELSISTNAMVYDINQGANGFATAYQIIDAMFSNIEKSGKAICIFGDVSEQKSLVSACAFEKKNVNEMNCIEKVLMNSYQDIYKKKIKDVDFFHEDKNAVVNELVQLIDNELNGETVYSNILLEGNDNVCSDDIRYNSAWIPHQLYLNKSHDTEVHFVGYGAGINVFVIRLLCENIVYEVSL